MYTQGSIETVTNFGLGISLGISLGFQRARAAPLGGSQSLLSETVVRTATRGCALAPALPLRTIGRTQAASFGVERRSAPAKRRGEFWRRTEPWKAERARWRRWGYGGMAACDRRLRPAARLPSARRFSQWIAVDFDWAKYTDEGWYGNAAIRAHLFGNWYMAGDFNPAVAVPVWPFVEWLLFLPPA